MKRGKINTSWKLRWFVYDPTTAAVGYQKSPQRMDLQGSIALEDVIEVLPVKALNALSALPVVLEDVSYRYCFDVMTTDRTYHLLAQFADELVEWLKVFLLAPNIDRKISQHLLCEYLTIEKKGRMSQVGCLQGTTIQEDDVRQRHDIVVTRRGTTDTHWDTHLMISDDGAFLIPNAFVRDEIRLFFGKETMKRVCAVLMGFLGDLKLNGKRRSEQFLENLLDVELNRTSFGEAIFQSESSALKFVEAYGQSLAEAEGKSGLYHSLLQPVVDNLWDEEKNDFEVDQDFIEEAEEYEGVVGRHALSLARIVHSILDQAIEFVPNCSGALRHLCAAVFATSEARFPGHGIAALASLLISRIVEPELLSGSVLGTLGERQQRAIFLIDKMLSAAAFGQHHIENYPWFDVMEQYIGDLSEKMHRFLRELSQPVTNPFSPFKHDKAGTSKDPSKKKHKDQNVFREFVLANRDELRIAILSSILVNKYGEGCSTPEEPIAASMKSYHAMINYLGTDMSHTWLSSKKRYMLKGDSSSPFRTMRDRKNRFSNRQSTVEDFVSNNRPPPKRQRSHKRKSLIDIFAKKLSPTLSSEGSRSGENDHQAQDSGSDSTMYRPPALPQLRSTPILSKYQPIALDVQGSSGAQQLPQRQEDVIFADSEKTWQLNDLEEDAPTEQPDDAEGKDVEEKNPTLGTVDLGIIGRSWITETLACQVMQVEEGNAGVRVVSACEAVHEEDDRLKVNPTSTYSSWDLNLVRKARHTVSLKKNRFIHDGFDLDLTYITNKVIAMGFPCEGAQTLYRNRLTETLRFLEYYHRDHYLIYNLCEEREYDAKKFGGRVVRFPFSDHNACPLPFIKQFCEHAIMFLKEDSKNVVAIHCKAGKGRTGLFVCCLMVESGVLPNLALDMYGNRRTRNHQGVTIPSQREYVHYYHRYVGNIAQYNANLENPKSIHRLEINNIRLKEGSKLFFQAITPSYHSGVIPVSDEPLPEKDTTVLYDSRMEIGLAEVCGGEAKGDGGRENKGLTFGPLRGMVFQGDMKLVFYTIAGRKPEKCFQTWINSAMVHDRLELGRSKEQIDDAVKDKGHRTFRKDFFVRMHFEDITEPATPESKGNESTAEESEEEEGVESSFSAIKSEIQKTRGLQNNQERRHALGVLSKQIMELQDMIEGVQEAVPAENEEESDEADLDYQLPPLPSLEETPEMIEEEMEETPEMIEEEESDETDLDYQLPASPIFDEDVGLRTFAPLTSEMSKLLNNPFSGTSPRKTSVRYFVSSPPSLSFGQGNRTRSPSTTDLANFLIDTKSGAESSLGPSTIDMASFLKNSGTEKEEKLVSCKRSPITVANYRTWKRVPTRREKGLADGIRQLRSRSPEAASPAKIYNIF